MHIVGTGAKIKRTRKPSESRYGIGSLLFGKKKGA